MPTELTDIEVEEVSLVDRPANQAARVLLFKRDGGPAEPTQVSKTALPTSLRSMMDMPQDKSAYIRKSDETVALQKADGSQVLLYKEDMDHFMGQAEEQTGGELATVLQALYKGVSEIALAEAAPEEKQAAIDQLFGEAEQMVGGTMFGDDEQDPGMLMKCFAGGALAVQKMQAKGEDQGEDINKGDGGQGDTGAKNGGGDVAINENDPLIKSMNERMAKLEAENAELRKREGVEAIRARLRKAHAPEDQAETLYGIQKAAGNDAFEAVMKGFETAGQRIAKAASVGGVDITKELGGAGKTVDLSKRDAMEAKISELRKSDSKLSYAQAYSHILKTDAEMQAAYAAGQLG